jgi:hypothetical protein
MRRVSTVSLLLDDRDRSGSFINAPEPALGPRGAFRALDEAP